MCVTVKRHHYCARRRGERWILVHSCKTRRRPGHGKVARWFVSRPGLEPIPEAPPLIEKRGV